MVSLAVAPLPPATASCGVFIIETQQNPLQTHRINPTNSVTTFITIPVCSIRAPNLAGVQPSDLVYLGGGAQVFVEIINPNPILKGSWDFVTRVTNNVTIAAFVTPNWGTYNRTY